MVAPIEDLERAGDVGRDRNPENRRAYVITLTAAGRRAQAKVQKAIDADAEHFFVGCPTASANSSTGCCDASTKRPGR